MTQPRIRRDCLKWTHLEDLRLGANLTREALAEEMGVTYDHMARVEQGRNRPGDKLLIALATRFRAQEPTLTARTLRDTNPLYRASMARREAEAAA